MWIIRGDSQITSAANVFISGDQNVAMVEDLGCQIFVRLFGGKADQTLCSLRNSLLAKKVSSAKSFVKPEKLPPTTSAAKLHSRRVYYQVMFWLGMDRNMEPKDWGWKIEDNHLLPVMMNQKPAPDSLLKVIHCNCTTGCSSTRCSCRRYGLPCTTACGSCQTDSCYNSHSDSVVDNTSEEGNANDIVEG